MRSLLARSLIVAFLAIYPLALFAMTSTNYVIDWDSLNTGGTDDSASANYQMQDTVGEHATGLSESESYELSAGYRIADAYVPALSLQVKTQESGVRSAYTSFSTSSLSVVVGNGATFAVGNYIAVIENEGLSELAAIGVITEINTNTLTVDAWAGDLASMSAAPSGSDDFVYRLEGSTAAFGTILPGEGKASFTAVNVVTNAQQGYTVSIQGLDGLHSASSTIQDVADGAVTLGQEEYGTRSVGDFASSSSTDLAIPTSTTRVIQSSTSPAISGNRSGVIYKLSIDNGTSPGSYEDTVMYRLTSNF
jgi:hypothetical protein